MRPIHRLRLRMDRPWRGFWVGVVLLLLAGWLRLRFGGLSQGFGPMTFLPAILLGGLIGGIQVGLVIAGLCVLVGWSWFFPPYGTFTLSTSDRISMAIFIVTAGLELYVIRMLRIAIDDLSIARERSNTLFRELQHRVANNLQAVAAFLYLRKKTLDPGSAGAEALDGAQSRLTLVSRVHRHLNNPDSIDLPLESSLQELSADLIAASNTPNIRLEVEAPAVEFDLETLMSLSLIVAELVTNSLKHAFPDGRDGSISIKLENERDVYTLTVADDGWGFHENVVNEKAHGLGQRILQNLASELGGQVLLQHGDGTVAKLVFKPNRTRASSPDRKNPAGIHFPGLGWLVKRSGKKRAA